MPHTQVLFSPKELFCFTQHFNVSHGVLNSLKMLGWGLLGLGTALRVHLKLTKLLPHVQMTYSIHFISMLFQFIQVYIPCMDKRVVCFVIDVLVTYDLSAFLSQVQLLLTTKCLHVFFAAFGPPRTVSPIYPLNSSTTHTGQHSQPGIVCY